MPALIIHLTAPASASLNHAYRLLQDGKESCQSFYDFYTASRGTKRGTGSHNEQDLLRAMVVFAGATLDATLRISVREVLPTFAKKSGSVRGLLKDKVSRRIRGVDTQGVDIEVSAILDSVFKETLDPVVDRASAQLTGKGVQDKTKAKRALAFVEVDIDTIWNAGIDVALTVRNDIVHELDARWSKPTGKGIKNRVQRKRDDMVVHAESLLNFSQAVLTAIDVKFAAL